MSTYEYIGQEYTQGGSPKKLVTFVASAKDIKRWGGVPSKNERFHGGFQRALSPRYLKIISYFDRKQISPGAIVVAFRPGVINITSLGHPSAWPKSESLSGTTNFVHLSFSSESLDDCELEDLIQRVKSLLESRPGFGSTPLSDESILESTSADDIPEPDETSATDEDESTDELDVGQSKLRAFYDFISNSSAIDAWLAAEKKRADELQQKKSLTKHEREYLRFPALERLRETLVSLLQPAMIVDGQHRVNGAAGSEQENIHFTVSAIQDADWVEQVFQFVVLNKMARPISKDFLTELLNTSLTNQEVDEIDKRLETIGIRNADRRIHKYINHDPRSPFKDLIAEAGEVVGSDNTGKLSQQGMLTLAKRWRSIAMNGKSNELNCYLKFVGVQNLGEARQKWQEYSTWISLFFAFWSEVKDLYEAQQVWVKAEKYHLLYIVTLQALQDLFIESKAKGRVKFIDESDFRAQVREFFSEVPGAFFRGWTETGLQSGKGWSLIKEAVEMFQSGSQLRSVTERSELFKAGK